jgi:hypothetical protein
MARPRCRRGAPLLLLSMRAPALRGQPSAFGERQARQQAQQQARLAQLLALFAHHEAMLIVIAQVQQAAAPAAAGQLAAMQQQLSAAMLVKGKNVQRSCLAWSARDRSEAHDEGRKRDEQRAD